MKGVVWLLTLAASGVLGYVLWAWRKRWRDHKHASEERLATFLAQTRPAAPPLAPSPSVEVTRPAVDLSVTQQRLLLEAAAKAGEAGEPALSIQLYARLIARYPDSTFGAQARAAVEAQKKRIATPRAPGTSAPG
jgi:hypothetical protein